MDSDLIPPKVSSDIPPLHGFHSLPSVGVVPDHNASIISVNIVMVVFALVVLLLRLASRIKIVRQVGVDDVFVVVSMVFVLAIGIIFCVAVHFGMGKHLGDILPPGDPAHRNQNPPGAHEETMIEMCHWINMILYPFALGFAKMSVIFFLLRLAPNKKFRRICHGLTTLVVCITLASAIATVFQCHPIPAVYDRAYNGTCMDKAPLYYSTSMFSIVTDCIIVGLPIPMLLKVQLPRRQKFILVFLFLLGGFVCIASIVRLTTLFNMTRGGDPPWDMAPFSVWTICEASLAVVCACLPALKPAVSKYMPKILNSSFLSSGKGKHSGTRYPLNDMSHSRRSGGKPSFFTISRSVERDNCSEEIMVQSPGESGMQGDGHGIATDHGQAWHQSQTSIQLPAAPAPPAAGEGV